MVEGIEFHSIIENVFHDVKGLNQSSQLQINCPRCQENNGLAYPDGKFNLEISTKRNKLLFRCWKCDNPKFSGSLGRLIKKYGSRLDYELYKSYGGTSFNYIKNDDESEEEFVQVELPPEMILFSDMNISNPDHFEAYSYLAVDRKISMDLMLKYKLGFCVSGDYEKRIVIPSYNTEGDVDYFVTRTYDPNVKKKKYDNPKSNKDRIIFNDGFINWDSTIYLVEGVFEMLTFPVNTIPMLGKTISTVLFQKLNKIKPNVIILLDPDAYNEAINLFNLIQNIYVGCEERVKLVKLPTDDDLDELRKNKGIEAVINSLYSARDLIVDDYFASNLKNDYGRRFQ